MRWKLLRRRLSISAPRMIVRSHMPWPVRWAMAALVFGFSAALALWAFEFGRDIAGLDGDAKQELSALRAEVQLLRTERDKAMSIANTAESLLKAGKSAQDQLVQQIKQVESENMALKADLGFFERLIPAGSGHEGISVRGLHAETIGPGQIRVQLLVMQPGKTLPEFHGRYEITLGGTLDGKPWTHTAPGGVQPLQVKQHLRIESLVDHPVQAVVKTVQVRLLDARGTVKAIQVTKL
jgi:hypothetical protein